MSTVLLVHTHMLHDECFPPSLTRASSFSFLIVLKDTPTLDGYLCSGFLCLFHPFSWLYTFYNVFGYVGDVIFAPNDIISVEKRTTVMWAAIRGAHKIPKKKKQGTKGNISGIFHRRLYAEVAAAPA